MKRILIIGPSWVGDMMMAQCLFKILKKQDPNVSIDVLAPRWSHGLLARMPEVTQALEAPFAHGQLSLISRRALGIRLRQQRYDHAIILPNSWKSALVPFYAKIPKRTGWRGEMRYGLINDLRVLNEQRYPLMVMRFAALAYGRKETLPDSLPKPELVIDTHQVTAALTKFSIPETKAPILALCPGAEFGASKRWPPEYFVQVARQQILKGNEIWLFGSKNDLPIAEEIEKALNQQCINLVGKTSLAEAIDLLSLASKVVTNDSGLMHIAAALNKTQIVIYGSTSPDFTPPLSEQSIILFSKDLECRPCFKRECPLKHHRCMRELTPEKVLEVLK